MTLPRVASPAAPPPVLDDVTRQGLLGSLVALLTRPAAGRPEPGTLSYATLRRALDALWELSGRDMAVALRTADQIGPVSGRSASTGRFGVSADLASRDSEGYAARRRPGQFLVAAVVAAIASLLLVFPALRKLAVALLAAVGLWALWFSLQRDVRELPPPRLAVLTVSFLAFMTAGLTAGTISLLRARGWLKIVTAPMLASAGALLVCAYTRSAGWFPTGGDGWSLITDPLACAVLAAPAALAISVGLGRGKT